ncbi:serine hydrolase domain-containing protein [Rhizorhabdus wittichii]|uniref:serine hydrolase domain-containing protein n=1 Tax=Rhizorhabdus wittichii TaxID=160791 RepID=UPI0002FA3A72|nr:serine hydrolase domain-containing protein [Rhizorhabdus wittichii]
MTVRERIEGRWDPAFRRVADAFLGLFDPARDGATEVGAAMCLIVEGRVVAHIWGGVADSAGTPWRAETAPCVFSCTKGVAASLFHILAEKHGVDYDAPVARWWPEFAAAGKADITVRELLAHQAGLGRLPDPAAPGHVLDWDRVTAALAAAPAFGTQPRRSGYHALTFGWLIGELMMRIAGDDLDTLLDRHLNGPLGTRFAWRGAAVPAGGVAMLASANPGEPVWATDGDARFAGITSLDDWTLLTPAVAASAGWRAANGLGAGGHSDAFSLATIYAALIDRRAPILPRERLALATTEQYRGEDALLGNDVAYGLGYQLPAGGVSLGHVDGPGTALFGHKGAYGSIGVADPDRGFALGYVTNLCGEMGDRSRNGALLDAALACF